MRLDMRTYISERLAITRKQHNLTQAEFLERLSDKQNIKVTPATLSAYELNKTLPPITFLRAVALEFKVSVDWLCGITDRDVRHRIVSGTYSEVINQLFAFLVFYHRDSDVLFRVTEGQVTETGVFDPCLHSVDFVINTYLESFKKMSKAYSSGAIDLEIFELWQEKMLEKFNFPIGKWEEHDGVLKRWQRDPVLCERGIEFTPCNEEVPWKFNKKD